MARRVRRAADTEDVVQALWQDGREPGPFPNIADVLVFAACLGYSRGCKEQFKPDAGKDIRWGIFEEAGYQHVVNMMALSEIQDPTTLGGEEEVVDRRISIFEQYAYGGFQVIRQEVLDRRIDVLDGLLSLVHGARKSEGESGSDEIDLSTLV